MQNYLFIGGANDGLSFPVTDDADFVQWPLNVTDSEVYARESFSVGDAFVDIFRHESLTPEEVLYRLVEHYKATGRSIARRDNLSRR
jgi:hypothetical protein